MKKFISMALALTMVFSAFTALVEADTLPTVTVETTKITDTDEIDGIIEALVDNGDIEDASDVDGYSLFKLDAYIEGLALSRGSASKIEGTMLAGFELAANGDMSKIACAYVSEPYYVFTSGSTGFSLGWDATGFKNTKSFPAKNQTVDVATPTLFYTAYVFVEDNASYTVASGSLATDVYSGGNSTAALTGYDSINYPASISFGSAPAPTTYTYTFKNADGTLDIDVQADLAAGAAVTAPTAPEVAGKVFDHWSETVGGAAVDVDATATADKTYYAVYVDAAPSYDTVTPEAPAQVFDSTKDYTDYDGNPVAPLTKQYAIARFETSISSAKEYKLHAEAPGAPERDDTPISFGGIEISGTANFVVILKNAPAGATMEIREFDKTE